MYIYALYACGTNRGLKRVTSSGTEIRGIHPLTAAHPITTAAKRLGKEGHYQLEASMGYSMRTYYLFVCLFDF